MTAATIIQTALPMSITMEKVPKDGRRLLATSIRAKSTAMHTVATKAVMMVRMRVKMEKACEARNRENTTERKAKPATTGWTTRTMLRTFSMMLTISGEIPASPKLTMAETL